MMTDTIAELAPGRDDTGRWRQRARSAWFQAQRRWYQGKAWAAQRTVRAAVPGWAGAVAVSWGIGGVVGHTIGHGLTPWVAFTLTGLFLLRLDARL